MAAPCSKSRMSGLYRGIPPRAATLLARPTKRILRFLIRAPNRAGKRAVSEICAKGSGKSEKHEPAIEPAREHGWPVSAKQKFPARAHMTSTARLTALAEAEGRNIRPMDNAQARRWNGKAGPADDLQRPDIEPVDPARLREPDPHQLAFFGDRERDQDAPLEALAVKMLWADSSLYAKHEIMIV